MITPNGFRDATFADMPVGTTVRVIAYGYGVRKIDVGRTGTVTAHGRTRVTVALTYGNGEPAGSITTRPFMLNPVVPEDGLTRITRGQDEFNGGWTVRRSHYVTPLLRVIMATRSVEALTGRIYVIATHYLGADEWTNGHYTESMMRADELFRARVASWAV